jgi:hypothetical protein
MKSEISRQIFENYWNIKFHENLSSGSRVVPCGRMDWQTGMVKLVVAFAILRTRLKKSWLSKSSLYEM